MGNVMIASIKVGDSDMKYCRFGNGTRNLVVIPGVSIKSVAEQGELIAGIFTEFTEDFTVFLFDRLTDMSQDYSVLRMAKDTVTALKELKIDKACFYGASQGGMLVQIIAEEWPDMVEKAVIASSAARVNPVMEEVITQWTKLALAHKARELAENFADRIYGESTLRKMRAVIVESNADATDAELDRFAIMASACLGMDRYDELGKIKAPVLIVGSEGDRVLTGEAAREMAERIGSNSVAGEAAERIGSNSVAGEAAERIGHSSVAGEAAERTKCELIMYGAEYGHGVYDEAAQDFFAKMKQFFV